MTPIPPIPEDLPATYVSDAYVRELIERIAKLTAALKKIEAFGEDEGNDDAGMMATEMYNIACEALASRATRTPPQEGQ